MNSIETNLTRWLNYYRENIGDFQLVETNYTATFVNAKNKQKFLTSEMPQKTFIAGALVKKDIKEWEKKNERPPLVKPDYFSSKNKIPPFFAEKVYNIDINGAYPNAAKKLGFISEKTFNYLMRVKKQNRLAALGMLASKKTITYYYNGDISDVEIVENELSAYFYAISREIDDVMKNICHNLFSFVFYWFDGVYFTESFEINKVVKELDLKGYPYKIETLEQFSLKRKSYNILIEFYKDGKKKSFEIPDKHMINRLKQLTK